MLRGQIMNLEARIVNSGERRAAMAIRSANGNPQKQIAAKNGKKQAQIADSGQPKEKARQGGLSLCYFFQNTRSGWS
jgi:hypothetical protein